LFAAVATAAALALAPPVGAVPWSLAYETASAGGHRWVERGSGVFPDVVVEGTLTGNGPGCHALWIRMIYDLAPAWPVKKAEVCGTQTAPVQVRFSGFPTTTGSVTVCRGTQDTQHCAAWQSITTWPVRPPA